MRKRVRWLVAILLALSLVAAACGNDDGGSDAQETEQKGGSGGDGGGSTDVGVSGDEIRVSQIVSTTGVNASGHAGFEKGFEAYTEALNEKGGVHGRKVKIVSTRSDNSEAPRQAAEFQQAVEQDKVFAVFGSWPGFGGAEYAIAQKVPVFGAPYDNTWQKSDSFFGTSGGSWKAPDFTNLPTAPASLSGSNSAYIAAKLGEKKFGTFGYTHPGSKAGAESACSAAGKLGLECVYQDVTLQFGFTDLGASIEKIKSSGARYFQALMDLSGCVTILRSLKRAGMEDAHLLCAVGYGPDAVEKFGDVVGNMFVVTGTAPFESDIPEMKRFVKELTTRKPGTDPSTTALNGWMAGILFEEALEEVGPNLTRAKLIETIRTGKAFSNWTARDIQGGIDWTTNRHEQYADPSFKPDPAICAGYLLRPDPANKRWVQVGEKPQLCLRGLTDAAKVKEKVAADKSKLTVR